MVGAVLRNEPVYRQLGLRNVLFKRSQRSEVGMDTGYMLQVIGSSGCDTLYLKEVRSQNTEVRMFLVLLFFSLLLPIQYQHVAEIRITIVSSENNLPKTQWKNHIAILPIYLLSFLSL